MIQIDVIGQPGTKGSMRAVAPGVVVPDSKKLKPWHAAVVHAAQDALQGQPQPRYVDAALEVSITFRFNRPKGHYGKKGLKSSAPALVRVRPDIDKVERATLDALTGIVFVDDARIARTAMEKRYCQPGEVEGCTILVREIEQ